LYQKPAEMPNQRQPKKWGRFYFIYSFDENKK